MLIHRFPARRSHITDDELALIKICSAQPGWKPKADRRASDTRALRRADSLEKATFVSKVAR